MASLSILRWFVPKLYTIILILGLLDIFNADLPIKSRKNTKSYRVKKHKKNLSKSIDEQPTYISEHEEFGHWEMETVV